MSCFRYRKIRNPLAVERRGFYDKFSISIPDCRCSKCRKQKQNDWLVRSYFEYTSKPTSAFFVTLDFDDEHLPVYDSIPCFDSNLMTRFFEILRNQSKLPPFRYLYASDYGGALERPHYHVAFLFDKDAVSLDDFSVILTFYWKFGNHEDIQQVNPRYKGNPFKCFEYICKYTTKDLKFELRTRESKLPARHRSRTYASVGYGAQCMDPSEFNSSRLIRDGVVFNDVPTITRTYMLQNSVVYLDIRNDGMLVPFTIPRYYELKLMYDYSYNCLDKKSSLIKNADGAALAQLRHNRRYVQLYNDILNSRNLNILTDEVREKFKTVYPDSPYNGVSWCDIVDDISIDSGYLFEFCKIYDYFEFKPYRPNSFISIPVVFEAPNGYKYLKNSYSMYGVDAQYIPYYKVDLFLHAFFIYSLSLQLQNLRNAHFDDWQQNEACKARLLYELQHNPQKRSYLRRKHFDFNKLKFKPYVPLNQIG